MCSFYLHIPRRRESTRGRDVQKCSLHFVHSHSVRPFVLFIYLLGFALSCKKVQSVETYVCKLTRYSRYPLDSCKHLFCRCNTRILNICWQCVSPWLPLPIHPHFSCLLGCFVAAFAGLDLSLSVDLLNFGSTARKRCNRVNRRSLCR